MSCIGLCHGADGLDPQLHVAALKAPNESLVLVLQAAEISKLHRDECRISDGELNLALDQRLQDGPWPCGRVLSDASAPLVEEVLADPDQHLGQQRVFSGEMLVQGRPRGAKRRTDVVDGDAVEAALGKQDCGNLQDLLTTGERLSLRHGHLKGRRRTGPQVST